MTKKDLFEKIKNDNIYWSYKGNSASDICDSVFMEHILIYSDVDEIKDLFFVFPFAQIKKIWDENIVPDTRFQKLNYYLAKFFFNIEDPVNYIKEKQRLNSRYEKLKRISEKY